MTFSSSLADDRRPLVLDTSVLINLHEFLGLASRADRYFRHQRPDAVIVIDYPGFHWWIAWRAKVHGIPVFYYVPPQIWAWAGWRVKKVRKYAVPAKSPLLK